MDSLLFHGTSIAKALAIVSSDTLGVGETGRVSMSRSYEKADAIAQSGYSDCAVLVLDRMRLAHKHHIRPVHDRNWQDNSPYSAGSEMHDEQKEAVTGTICSLSRCLVSVNISPNLIDRLLASDRLPYEFREEFSSDLAAKSSLRAIATHVAFNKWFTRAEQVAHKRAAGFRPGDVIHTRQGWIHVASLDRDEACVHQWSHFGRGWNTGLAVMPVVRIIPVPPGLGETPPQAPYSIEIMRPAQPKVSKLKRATVSCQPG